MSEREKSVSPLGVVVEFVGVDPPPKDEAHERLMEIARRHGERSARIALGKEKPDEIKGLEVVGPDDPWAPLPPCPFSEDDPDRDRWRTYGNRWVKLPKAFVEREEWYRKNREILERMPIADQIELAEDFHRMDRILAANEFSRPRGLETRKDKAARKDEALRAAYLEVKREHSKWGLRTIAKAILEKFDGRPGAEWDLENKDDQVLQYSELGAEEQRKAIDALRKKLSRMDLDSS